MKIKPKQYAKGLIESIKEMEEKEAKDAIRKFANIIVRNNQISQLDEIIKHFELLWNKQKGIIDVEIISANKLDKETSKLLENYISSLLEDKKANIEYRIDDDIIGGFVVRLGDIILDSSLETRVEEMKKTLIK